MQGASGTQSMSTSKLILGLLTISIAVPACSSEAPANTSDELVACSASKLPTDGSKCDVKTYGREMYCRLESCAWNCANECNCVDGRWKCTMACRDNYGCGTAPLCRVQPCSFDAGADSVADATGNEGAP